MLAVLKALDGGSRPADLGDQLLDSLMNNKPEEAPVDEAKLLHECGQLLKPLIKRFCVISKVDLKQQKQVKFKETLFLVRTKDSEDQLNNWTID